VKRGIEGKVPVLYEELRTLQNEDHEAMSNDLGSRYRHVLYGMLRGGQMYDKSRRDSNKGSLRQLSRWFSGAGGKVKTYVRRFYQLQRSGDDSEYTVTWLKVS
jgi:hypothetical protein